MKKKSEILSPAGNLEILKQVINAGADAVYFGGDLFGARAYAKNFSREDALEGIRYAHLHGAQAYLTVNTLLKNKEIQDYLYQYLKYYYESGLDAVIVQDMAVLQMIRSYFPDLAVHASTQMTIASAGGAKFMEELGATRIVTSRELSLQEIRQIKDATNVEIETFVHGALCVCYSGDCFMSSILGGRSGNRGRCAQPCRLPYDVYGDGCKLETGGKFVLSPKDLCGINDLKDMLDAGVYSFKIEGRMKSNTYAANVTAIYRKAMDLILSGAYSEELSRDFYKELLELGNRNGFTDGYFHKQNGKDMMSLSTGSHENAGKEYALFPETKIQVQGVFTATVGQEMSLSIYTKQGDEITVFGPVVEVAQKNPAQKDDVEKRLRKTGNTSFAFQDVQVYLNGDVFLPVKALNQIRREALERMEMLLTKVQRSEALPKSDFHGLPTDNLVQHPSHMVTVRTMEQLNQVLKRTWIHTIGIGHMVFFEDPERIRQIAKERDVCLVFPDVFRYRAKRSMDVQLQEEDLQLFQSFCVGSYDSLQYLKERGVEKKRIRLDHRLYTFSNDSLDAFRSMGYSRFTAPYELNQQELRHRENGDSTLIVYGYIPLMVMANCTHKNFEGCDQKMRPLELEDRYHKRFPVRNDCSICMNTIYNTLPYEIFSRPEVKDLGFGGYRVDFTIEDAKHVETVLDLYEQAVIQHKKIQVPFEATRGHFKRGVE